MQYSRWLPKHILPGVSREFLKFDKSVDILSQQMLIYLALVPVYNVETKLLG